MADPIRETIVAAYVTALQAITTANGYEIDLESRVLRGMRLTPHTVPTVCVVTEGETAQVEKPARHYRMNLIVHCFLFIRRTDDLDTQLNKGVADVKKAILSAATLFGGGVAGTLNAIDWTHFVRDEWGVITDESAGETVVQQITFETQYLHKYDDPYVGRGSG